MRIPKNNTHNNNIEGSVMLGDILDYEQSSKFGVHSTKYDDSYSTPVLTAGKTFLLGYTNETDNIYKASDENPVILFDDFTTASKLVTFDFKVKSTALKILKAKNGCGITTKFVYFYMQTINYMPIEHRRQYLSTYSRFKIPIPSIDTQNKVVDFLDQFKTFNNELEESLIRERELRNIHLSYYQTRLLNSDMYSETDELIKFESYRLYDLCTINKGEDITKKKISESRGNYPVISGGKQPLGFIDRYNTINNPIGITDSGAYAGYITWTEGKYFRGHHNFSLKIKDSDILGYRYLYYLLNHHSSIIKRMCSSGSIPTLRKSALSNLKLHVPPRTVQDKIVKSLDDLGSLTNRLQNDISSELEARQKQYEYYRDYIFSSLEEAAA